MEPLLVFVALAAVIYYVQNRPAAPAQTPGNGPSKAGETPPNPNPVAPTTEELLRAQAAANEAKIAAQAAEQRARAAEARANEAVAGRTVDAAQAVADAARLKAQRDEAVEAARRALQEQQIATQRRDAAVRYAASVVARVQPQLSDLQRTIREKQAQLSAGRSAVGLAASIRWNRATEIPDYSAATGYLILDDRIATRPYAGPVVYVNRDLEPVRWGEVSGEKSGASFRGLPDPLPNVRLSTTTEETLLRTVAALTRDINAAQAQVEALEAEMPPLNERAATLAAELAAAQQTMAQGSSGAPVAAGGEVLTSAGARPRPRGSRSALR